MSAVVWICISFLPSIDWRMYAWQTNGGNKMDAWETCFKEVYALAEAHMAGIKKAYDYDAAVPVARL
jgi:hypothetical protein